MNVASSDAEGLARAIQMISDITAVPEMGKTYLGKVVRLAEFGAFVEIFPGTDGLLHVSEIAEHRVKEVKDELREGDQILVRVLSIEGNRIKLSRKALMKEQRAKLGLPEEGGSDAPPTSPDGGGSAGLVVLHGISIVVRDGATQGVALEHRASRHQPSGSLIRTPARSRSRAETTSMRSTASTLERTETETMSRTSTAPMACR